MLTLINLNLTTKTKNYANLTLKNLSNERYNDLVRETVELREQGYTFDEIDEILGLEAGTPNSCYALMKQQAAKAIARSIKLENAVEKIVSEIR